MYQKIHKAEEKQGGFWPKCWTHLVPDRRFKASGDWHKVTCSKCLDRRKRELLH